MWGREMNCITKKLSCVLFSFVLLGCTTPSNKTSTITSEESPSVKMRVQDGYIQYYNGTDWENLISTEELKGEKGDKGDPGKDGKDGRDGKNGTNGTNGINGVNGKNGSDGNDAENGITKGFLLYTEANGNIPFQNDPWSGGYIEIESLDKSVISSKSVEDNSKITSVNLLMNENGKVKLTAKSSAGWNFVKWSDGSTNPSRTISYDSAVILSAYFDCTKKPLTTPVILTEDIDCDKQSLYLVWKTDENAKDYTITVSKGYSDSDIIYSGKSTTNNITINSDKLEFYNTYYIGITANPKNPDAYYAQSVYNICSTEIHTPEPTIDIPTIEPIVVPTQEPTPTIEPTQEPTPEPNPSMEPEQSSEANEATEG